MITRDAEPIALRRLEERRTSSYEHFLNYIESIPPNTTHEKLKTYFECHVVLADGKIEPLVFVMDV